METAGLPCVCAHLLCPHIENHEFSLLPPLLIQFCRAFVLPFLTVVTLAPIVLGLVTEAIRLSMCNKPPMPAVTVFPTLMSSSPQHLPVWALKPAPCWALPRAHWREIDGAGGGRRAWQLPAGSSSFQGVCEPWAEGSTQLRLLPEFQNWAQLCRGHLAPGFLLAGSVFWSWATGPVWVFPHACRDPSSRWPVPLSAPGAPAPTACLCAQRPWRPAPAAAHPPSPRCAEPCAQASPVQLLLAVFLVPRCIGCFLLLLFRDNPTRFHLFSYLATSPVWHFPQTALCALSLDAAGPPAGPRVLVLTAAPSLKGGSSPFRVFLSPSVEWLLASLLLCLQGVCCSDVIFHSGSS